MKRPSIAPLLTLVPFVVSITACSAADGGASLGAIGDPPASPTGDAGPAGASSDPPETSPVFAPEDSDAGGEAAPEPPKEPELVPVKELAIEELALFQGVKVPLEKDGVRDDGKKVHVVAGREGILRVYVAPTSAWSAREVVAEVTLQAEGKPATVLTAARTVTAASTDASLDSTINVAIPSGAIEVGMRYRVRLLTKPGQGGTVTRASFPEGDALEALDVWDTGASLKVVLVPVKSNGRVPDVSDEQIARYRKQLQAMYPVRTIDLKVRDVYEYTGTLGAGGSGIYALLDAVTALRKRDGAASDVYYYGVFTPTSTFSTYCSGGCTTGLCHLPGPSDTYLRACVGVGFTGSSSAATMAHELGHAHGIRHAPCGGVSGSDSSYPYTGGKIGSWGIDLRSNTLMSPTKHYDFMSYCGPEWISDYAFDRITHRMDYVRKNPLILGGEARTYTFVHVLADGSLEWGSDITLDEPMFGEPHEVAYVGKDGTRAKVTGYFHPYGEDGGSLLVPKATTAFDAIEVSGFSTIARRLPAVE